MSDGFWEEVAEVAEVVAIADGDPVDAAIDAGFAGGDPVTAALDAELLGGLRGRRRSSGFGLTGLFVAKELADDNQGQSEGYGPDGAIGDY